MKLWSFIYSICTTSVLAESFGYYQSGNDVSLIMAFFLTLIAFFNSSIERKVNEKRWIMTENICQILKINYGSSTTSW